MINLRLLSLPLVMFSILFLLYPQQISAETILGGCDMVDLNLCNPDLFDHDRCYNTFSEFEVESPDDFFSNPDDNNFSESSCLSLVGGCFIEIPGHPDGRGVCVPPINADFVNCANVYQSEYADVCNQATYQICYDTSNPIPYEASVLDIDCDCEVIPTEGPSLCFFESNQSYQQKIDSAPIIDDPEFISCQTVNYSSWANECPQSTYQVCFEYRSTSFSPLPQDAIINDIECDCFLEIPVEYDGIQRVPTKLCFFRNQQSYQQSYDAALASGPNPCRQKEPLGDGPYTMCAGNDADFPVSCVTSTHWNCCVDETSCEEIGGRVERCESIGRYSANLGDCESIYSTKPVLCGAGITGSEYYYCCETESSCDAIGDFWTGGRPVSPQAPHLSSFQPPDHLFEMCKQIPNWDTTNSNQYNSCMCCATDESSCEQINRPTPENVGIWSAVGCLSYEPKRFVEQIVFLGLTLSGGILLLILLSGAFLITTGRGDPQQMTKAKEMITSAIIGTLMIVFSVVILRFIASDLLRIPGFGE